MEFKGYRLEEKNNSIIVANVKDFNPVHIFECGQCFRWLKQDDNTYTGIVGRKAVNVRFNQDILTIGNSNAEDFANIWYGYFDLGTDYSLIKRELAEKDGVMAKAVEFGYGIRILKQDFWETLVSFILSANNRIPMIMKVVANLSEMYGEKIEYNGCTCFSFPQPGELSNECESTLKACKGGFRCKYIIGAARTFESGGFNIGNLRCAATREARKVLTGLAGVGNKVADCTLLYSGLKSDIFPTDVWIKRIVENLYFKRKASMCEIQDFAASHFGELAGYAQQYLFYYARENRIGGDVNVLSGYT